MQAYTNFMHGVYDMYGIPPWEDGLSMKQKASLKFYLREYLHLPTIVIAELCNVQHYHLLRDLRALDERAVDKAVPVVMQPRYRETLEQMDDLARDMGLEPAPLGNMSPERRLNALWMRAVEIGRPGAYDGEEEVQADLRTLVEGVYDCETLEDAIEFVKRDYIVYLA